MMSIGCGRSSCQIIPWQLEIKICCSRTQSRPCRYGDNERPSNGILKHKNSTLVVFNRTGLCTADREYEPLYLNVDNGCDCVSQFNYSASVRSGHVTCDEWSLGTQ